MLPARGWVARLLKPADWSAVGGRTRDVALSLVLRSGHERWRLRSLVTLAPRWNPMLLRSPGGSPYQSANRVVSRHPVDADVVHDRLDEAVGGTVARLEEQAHSLAGVGVERDRGQQPLRVALARRPARSPHLLAVDKQAQVVG